MHVTSMHFAFLKAANLNSDMGKRVIAILQRQHDQMVREQAERALAKAKQAERLATSSDVE